MSRKGRLERLERKAAPKPPALLFLTEGGLRDLHNRPVDRAPAGVKLSAGVDPRDV